MRKYFKGINEKAADGWMLGARRTNSKSFKSFVAVLAVTRSISILSTQDSTLN